MIARAFPAQRAFVQNVIDSFDQSYTFGPYQNDKLILQTERLVEFQTPAHSEGLGTMSRLKPVTIRLMGLRYCRDKPLTS